MKNVLKHSGIMLYFTILTVIYSYPLIFSLNTHIPYGYEGPTDGLLLMWSVMENVKKIEDGAPFSFEGNIFYPEKNTLAFGDRHIFNSFIGFFILKFTDNRTLVFNILFFLVFVLSGYGMFLLAHSITKSFSGALISATAVDFYGFYFYPQNFYASAWQWCFFSLYFFHRFVSDRKIVFCIISAFFYILSWYSTVHAGTILTYVIACYFIFALYNRPSFFNSKTVMNFVIIFLISGLILFPYLFPYMKLYNSFSEVVERGEKIRTSYTFLSFFSIKKETSLLWWKITGGMLDELNDWDSFYGLTITLSIVIFFKSNFRGLLETGSKFLRFLDRVALILIYLIAGAIIVDTTKVYSVFHATGSFSTIGLCVLTSLFLLYYFIFRILLFRSQRDRFFSAMLSLPGDIRFYVYVFIFAFLLSLGPLAGFYYIAEKVLPGFAGFRAPHRIFKVGLIACGIISAFVLKNLTKVKYGKILIPVIFLFIIAEYYNAPVKLFYVPAGNEIPEVYKWLSPQEGEFAILELPLQKPESFYKKIEEKRKDLLIQTQFMYLSTFHKKKLVNGYSSFIPSWYMKLCEDFINFPDQKTIFITKNLGVRYVLIHEELIEKDIFTSIKSKLDTEFPFLNKFYIGNTLVIDLW